MLLFIAVFCLFSSNYLHVQTILVPSVIKIMNCYFIRVRSKRHQTASSSAFYSRIRLLFPHPSIRLLSSDRSTFYPPIRLLSSHPPCILSSAFYFLCFLSPHPPFIPLSAFYPLMRRLDQSSHPPSVSAFYPDPYSTVRAKYS